MQGQGVVIGYFVEDDMHEELIRGLAVRWCPFARLERGRFRGQIVKNNLRNDIRLGLERLFERSSCNIVIFLTDSDKRGWHEKRKEEAERIPQQYVDRVIIGIAEQNIEHWLSINKAALASELQCRVEQIPENPTGFVKRKLGVTDRRMRCDARKRVREFVSKVQLKSWIY